VIDERRFVGGCVVNEDGLVIYSGIDGLASYDPQTNRSQAIETSLDSREISGVNDIEADGQGNIYGGTIDLAAFETGEPKKPGVIFKIDTNGSVTEFGSAGTPNGLAFSADGATMYLSESGQGVFSYDVGADGRIENRTLFTPVEDSDGLALDERGGLWVARYLCNELVCYGSNGSAERVLKMPYNSVSSLAFGGDDLKDLYVTGGDLSEPGTGGVLKLRAEVAGLAPYFSKLNC
jgi:gluconolactonase